MGVGGLRRCASRGWCCCNVRCSYLFPVGAEASGTADIETVAVSDGAIGAAGPCAAVATAVGIIVAVAICSCCSFLSYLK